MNANVFGLLLVLLLALITDAQKQQHNVDMTQYDDNQASLSKVYEQLLGAMAMVDQMQEGNKITAEKRRNKFEFIRFGRK
mgnify:CR=1 FL=1